MPIREIRTDDLDQECAKCGAVRALDHEKQMGVQQARLQPWRR
jgi:hypothetical protein